MNLPSESNEIILEYFRRIETDLPQVALLQKNVGQAYAKALDVFNRFVRVHGYRLHGTKFDDMTFVDTLPQLESALAVLNDLAQCVELKIEFPFEHLLLDCIIFAQLLVDQDQSSHYISEVEALFQSFLLTPIVEIRERILRQLF